MLDTWLQKALEIDRRRPSAARHRAINRHGQCFPFRDVSAEIDRDCLRTARRLLRGELGAVNCFGRPPRGHRANHWTTPALMAVQNQLARLGPGNY